MSGLLEPELHLPSQYVYTFIAREPASRFGYIGRTSRCEKEEPR